MQDMLDIVSEVLKVSPLGHKTFAPEFIINATDYCLTLLRTDAEVITNPYIKAKALEMIALFHQAD